MTAPTRPAGKPADDPIRDIIQRKDAEPGKPSRVRGFTKRSAGAGWSDEVIDLAPLGFADADVALSVERLLYKEVQAGPGRLTLALKDKVANITLEDSELYGGRGRGLLTLDGTGQTAVVGANLEFQGVSVLPLLKGALGFEWLEGQGAISLAVAGQGNSERQVVETLNGKVVLTVNNGAVAGISIPKVLREIERGRLPGLEPAPGEKTPFSELAGTFVIAGGIANNQDLRLVSPHLHMRGAGAFNLPERRMDYTVNPKIAASATSHGAVINLAGLEIPVRIDNGPITVYGGWLFVLAFLGALLFYWRKGPIKLKGQPTGRMIERFTPFERIIHWTTAISFVILALSGIVLLFGKYVLLPIFGYTLFSWLAILSKTLHNFVGPLFVVCTLIMTVVFIGHNIPRAYDWIWIRKFGGMVSGEHVPAGKSNAGQKLWFWGAVVGLGIVVSVTGLILDFPNFAQGRSVMQQANVVHAIAAVLYMTISLGHIYLGTIGMEGAYDAMRHGYVDETWAKEHHEYWYNEVKGQGRAAGGAPSAAHASAMKEGWKL